MASPKKLNVLLVTNLFPNPQEPLRGTFVGELADRLKERANLVVVSPLPWFPRAACFRRASSYRKFSLVPSKFDHNGTRVYSPKYLALPKLGIIHPLCYFLAVFPTVARLVKRAKIDVVNAHWLFPDGTAVAFMSRILGVPVVLNAHGSDLNLYLRFPLRRSMILRAIRSAKQTFLVSSAQRGLLERAGAPSDRISVVPNGVDSRLFQLRNKSDCRKRVGIDESLKVVLFAGHMTEVKAVWVLIDALPQLRQAIGDRLRIVLAGEGPLRPSLEARVEELGLRKEVVFTGPIPRNEIPYWFGACDVFCLPSIQEGSPCVVVESLASGRPVVASAVGGIPDVIGEGNGILVEPEKPESLANALQRALQKQWSEQDIALSVSGYTWDVIADRYIATFHELVDEAPSESVMSGK